MLQVQSDLRVIIDSPTLKSSPDAVPKPSKADEKGNDSWSKKNHGGCCGEGGRNSD
jgi:hypothetical protein